MPSPRGSAAIVVDSFDELDRLERVTAILGPHVQPVMVRVTAGVEAHTHEYIATAHEDQKFGFSITCGDALEAVRRVVAAPGLELLGLHSHIGSQIFDTSGFEVAARRVLALHAQVGAELGVTMPSSTSAAASASPTRPRTTRPTRRSWRSR